MAESMGAVGRRSNVTEQLDPRLMEFSEQLLRSPDTISILVVDDEPVACRIVAMYLKKAGYRVQTCSSAEHAIDMMLDDSSLFDLVLTDVNMPKINGIQMLQKLRSDDRFGHVPIVMMSANEETDMVYQCMRTGADDFLLKPVSMMVLREIWSGVWKKRREKEFLRILEKERRLRQEMERTVDDLRDQISVAIDTPVSIITRTISQLVAGDQLAPAAREALHRVLALLHSDDLYRPALEKVVAEGGDIDEETRSWLVSELRAEDASHDSATSVSVTSPTAAPREADAPTPIVSLAPAESGVDGGRTSSGRSRSLGDTSSGNSESEKTPLDTFTAGQNEKLAAALRKVSESAGNGSPSSPRRARATTPPAGGLTGLDSTTSSLFPSNFSSKRRATVMGLAYSDVESLVDPADITAPAESAAQALATDPRSWHFDIWAYPEDKLPGIVVEMFRHLGLLERFKVEEGALLAFLDASRRHYRNNPYHNFRHSIDVCQACFLLLSTESGSELLTPVDTYALMLAALCHDLEHPGQNNNYHMAVQSDVALRYNDRSVLENHHCYITFVLLRGDHKSLIEHLSPAEYKSFRGIVLDSILATDLSKHMDLISAFRGLVERGYQQEAADDRKLLVQLLMKAGDISNPLRPFHLSQYWTDLIQEEVLAQGDLEREQGIPVSPFMDRHNKTTAKMTCGFIDFIVKPMYAEIAHLLPSLNARISELTRNRERWSTLQESQNI